VQILSIILYHQNLVFIVYGYLLMNVRFGRQDVWEGCETANI